MLEIKRSIGQGFAGTPGGLYDILVQLQNGMLPISGKTYYVSPQGNNTDGSSWKNAYTTIAGAIAASNTFTALTENVGRRNRIYIDGKENWDEDLTVLPNKCDMIGVGATYGKRPRIRAVQTITTVVRGCHIYNLCFENDTNGICFTLPHDVSEIEFYNCIFTSVGGIQNSIALKLTGGARGLKVIGCRFQGSNSTTIGIEFNGQSCFSEIRDNFISAITTGISIAAAVATSDYQLVIRDNIICRSDANSGNQLTTGIAMLQTAAQSHVMIVHNFISATDAIAFTNAEAYGGSRDEWCCIGNYINEGAVAGIEDGKAFNWS